jgi:hypothetical protein
MPLDLVYICRGSPCPNDILVELSKKYFASQFSPHITFASLSTKYANLDFKVVCVFFPFVKGNLQFPACHEQKTIMGALTNVFSLHWWNHVPWQIHTKMKSSFTCVQFHPNHTYQCTQHLVCLSKNATWCYYLRNHCANF